MVTQGDPQTNNWHPWLNECAVTERQLYVTETPVIYLKGIQHKTDCYEGFQTPGRDPDYGYSTLFDAKECQT